MTGPEHYAEVERLLSVAHDLADQGHQSRAEFIVARAQVHATLALVAATAGGAVNPATDRPLATPPIPADDGGVAYPGNDWGRAICGEVE